MTTLSKREDPFANDLHLIEHGLGTEHPSFTDRKARALIEALDPLFTQIREWLTITGAMDPTEYMTMQNHACVNPVDDLAQDFFDHAEVASSFEQTALTVTPKKRKRNPKQASQKKSKSRKDKV